MVQIRECLVWLLLVGLRYSSSVSDGQVSHCPVWRWFNHSSGECQCGSQVMDSIKCSEGNDSVFARFDICVSLDTHSQTVLAGLCKYKRSRSAVTNRVYSKLPESPYNLSYDECELNNREGVFCGRCKEGFAPSLYIFSGMCVNCTYCLQQNPSSILLYLASEIVPLTLFYLIIMGLHVNIASGPMLGYAIFCQAHINIVHIHPNIWEFILSHSRSEILFVNKYLLLPLAGMWNLNFFAMFIPNLCYNCNFNVISGIVMQYISVIYIFILVAITYYVSRLSVKRKPISGKFSKLFLHSLARWRLNLNFSDSALHALATFSALLFAKVGVISTQLIVSKQVYNINGTLVKSVLSFEPSIEAFSDRHIPYATAGFISILIFVILPLAVLLVYPSRHFHKLLSHCCGPRQRLALVIFVEIFYGGYRDGLDGGLDWRFFFPASFTLFAVAIIILVSTFHSLNGTYYLILFPFNALYSIAVLYFKPCKSKQMNASLSFHLLIIGLSSLTLALWMQDYFMDARVLEIFLTVCLTLPHVVMLLLLLSNILQRWHSLKNCCQKIKQLSFGRSKFLLHTF